MNNSSEKYIPNQEELNRIRNIKEENIDLSDAPETDAQFWQSAKFIQNKLNSTTNRVYKPTNRQQE